MIGPAVVYAALPPDWRCYMHSDGETGQDKRGLQVIVAPLSGSLIQKSE